MTDPAFSVAVFPFLKTSGPVRIGGYTFRSTIDVGDLPTDQVRSVTEIAQMLFVQGDLRIRSASYAITPTLDLDHPSDAIDQLVRVRAVVAYLYSSPHEVFDNLFLAPEEVSLVLFTPGPISVFLVRPEFHTERLAEISGPAPDKHHNVPGYRGLYNFQHYFWVERDSRLYGPKPHMILNHSQDLSIDLEHHFLQRADYHLLLKSLNEPLMSAKSRIYSALHWYNAANADRIDRDRALLNLAVAFETLLRLPNTSKSERLVDAITLLLGRTERLNEWADQFYSARSRVAHEGSVQDPYFYIPDHRKARQAAGLFGSLMLYGRHVFQLCLGTLLAGIDLAERADLQEKFLSNNERYQKICDLLEVKVGAPGEKLLGLEPILRALRQYQFIAAGEVSRGTLISAIRCTAATLIATRQPFPQNLGDALAKVAAIRRDDGEFLRLSMIKDLIEAFEATEAAALTPEACIARDLVKIAWMKVFEIYYWLKDRSQSET